MPDKIRFFTNFHRKGLAIELQIEKWVYGGEGLARAEGRVVLAPYVLPGERVEVEVSAVNAGLLRASSVNVLEAAPERVTPPCVYFGTCGGCQYQHAAYELQLRQKELILRETLLRTGGFEYAGPIRVVSGEPWHYRNRIQLQFEKPRSGFRRAGSHRLCAVDFCHIVSPTLVDAIKILGEAAKAPQWPAFLRSLDLFTNERELQVTVADTTKPVAARFFEWLAPMLPGFAPGAIEYSAAGFNFRIGRGSFFQVNRFLIDELVKTAIQGEQGDYAVDLYAGVGLFSLPLSQAFSRVQAVERSAPATKDLQANIQAHGRAVESFKKASDEFLSGLNETPDLVIADPPRAGLGSQAVSELLRLQPKRLTLISCDPATLSRDLKRLLSVYDVERMAMVDLFPQTYHFETVVHLNAR